MAAVLVDPPSLCLPEVKVIWQLTFLGSIVPSQDKRVPFTPANFLSNSVCFKHKGISQPTVACACTPIHSVGSFEEETYPGIDKIPLD